MSEVCVKPTKPELEDLYINQRISPCEIGPMYGVTGRTIRTWMSDYGIPRMGPAHLLQGKVASWNVGRTHTKEHREKNRLSNTGKTPYNKGIGSVSFYCEVCGTRVTDKPYRRKRTCSKACKDMLSSIHRGEAHWNYKGDEAAFRQRKRNWAEYSEWRSDVLSAANYTCVFCSKHGGRLTAHHIFTFNDHHNLRFDANNGACLCRSCHADFHSIYGRHHTNAEMFDEWLSTK